MSSAFCNCTRGMERVKENDRVSDQFSDDSNNRTLFQTFTMVYGRDLVPSRPGINIQQNRVRTFATFGTRAANAMSDYIECRTKVGSLDKTSWVRSTYLGWTTGFNSDGVFTMESCSPSFSRLNFTVIVTLILSDSPDITHPFHRSSKGQG